jgi:hypothetical protein
MKNTLPAVVPTASTPLRYSGAVSMMSVSTPGRHG